MSVVLGISWIINTITRRPGETPGGLLAVHGGRDDASAAVRWGGDVGEARVRAYARRFRLDPSENDAGQALADGWDGRQAGFRAEWGDDARRLTLQGAIHEGEFADVGATVNAWLGGKAPSRGIPGTPILAP